MTGANFSRPPDEVLAEAIKEGYGGLHFEQGVPLLDRDLNLLRDFFERRARRLVTDYWSDGVCGADDFKLTPLTPADGDPLDGDFWVNPGTAIVGGLEVTANAPVRYSRQVTNAAIPDLPGGGEKTFAAYLDAWQAEMLDDFGNAADIGVRTSTRLQTEWVVRLVEETKPPSPALGHETLLLAAVTRRDGRSVEIRDLRRQQRRLPDLLRPRVTEVAPRVAVGDTMLTISGENLGPYVERIEFRPEGGSAPVERVSVEPLCSDVETGRVRVRIPSNVPPRCTVHVVTDYGESSWSGGPLRVLRAENLSRPHGSDICYGYDFAKGPIVVGACVKQVTPEPESARSSAAVWFRKDGQWSAELLPVPEDSTDSAALAVSNCGQIVGWCQGGAGGQYAVLWRRQRNAGGNGTGIAWVWTRLELPSSIPRSNYSASAVTNGGRCIIGGGGPDARVLQWMQDGDNWIPVVLGEAMSPVCADRSGIIGGSSPSGDEYVQEPLLLVPSGTISLVYPLRGVVHCTGGEVLDVSNGWACGYGGSFIDADFDARAFVWHRGQTTVLRDGGTSARATGVSRNGVVVGCSDTTGAQLWPSIEEEPIQLGVRGVGAARVREWDDGSMQVLLSPDEWGLNRVPVLLSDSSLPSDFDWAAWSPE